MKDLGIYVHIPFCKRKCAYCDFLSFPAGGEEIEEYLGALENEIALSGRVFKERIVDTVFIGGGTPSILGSERIRAIVSIIGRHFDIAEGCEISCEVNPGAYDGGAITNRVSVGLQSASDGELKTLGRIHDLKTFEETFAALRKAGVNNINVDIMFGIPGQTKESLFATLDEVAKMGPEHISAYSLIIEEGTPFYDRYEEGHYPLPDEKCEREMYRGIIKYLKECGYRQYEISNFAKPGFECAHNLKYWDRKDYLGLGLGASSMTDNIRWKNTGDIREYTDLYGADAIPDAEIDYAGYMSGKKEIAELTKEEQMEEFMFLGLRKTDGILKEDFKDAFGKSVYEEYGEVIARYAKRSLLVDTGERIMLTPDGVDVSNVIMSEFLH